MGDLPLRTPIHHRLGGPLPRRLPNGAHPHPIPQFALLEKSCGFSRTSGINLSFEGLSPSKGQVGYVLLTRLPLCARKRTARLACVKPVASVHPEPGSNSSLYFLIPLRSPECPDGHRTNRVLSLCSRFRTITGFFCLVSLTVRFFYPFAIT